MQLSQQSCEASMQQSITESVTESMMQQSVSERMTQQSVSESTMQQSVTESTTQQSVTESTTQQSVTESTTQQSVSESTTQVGILFVLELLQPSLVLHFPPAFPELSKLNGRILSPVGDHGHREAVSRGQLWGGGRPPQPRTIAQQQQGGN